MRKATRLQDFPERFQEAVTASKLSDAEIAQRCERDRKTIMSYRHGEATPDCLTLARLCYILNVSADYLVLGRK